MERKPTAQGQAHVNNVAMQTKKSYKCVDRNYLFKSYRSAEIRMSLHSLFSTFEICYVV